MTVEQRPEGRFYVLQVEPQDAARWSMHYERAPLLQKVEARCGAAFAPLRGATLRHGRGSNCCGAVSAKGLQEGSEWRQAPPLRETVELGQATGAGIAAGMRGDPKRQNKKPLEEGDRAGCKSSPSSLEGRGKTFFLTSF